LTEHWIQANNHSVAEDSQSQKGIEKEFGSRYSILLELPYWDPIRLAVVDLMHNLFLGTAKRVMKIWVEKDCITKQQFKKIEYTVSKIITPRSVGRLPLKIASGFSGFTADQWKNWIVIFSPVALKDILDPEDLHCWLLFVRSCFLISNQILATQAVEEIHSYLIRFSKSFEELYGAGACSPNIQCVEVQIIRKYETQIQSVHAPAETTELPDTESGAIKKYRDTDIWKHQSLAEHCNLYSNFSITCGVISLLPS